MGTARKLPSGPLLKKFATGIERRKQIVAFLASYHEANHRPPTVMEIVKGIGVTSTGHVSYHLDRLEADGVISRSSFTARGVMLTQSPCRPLPEIRQKAAVTFWDQP